MVSVLPALPLFLGWVPVLNGMFYAACALIPFYLLAGCWLKIWGGIQRWGLAADATIIYLLVGGLGFGPSVELSTCPVQFDPRLETTCNAQTGPIPAGGLLCPGCGRFLFSFSSRSAMHLTGPSATRNVLAP